MKTEHIIEKAISNFTEWNYPWKFRDHCLKELEGNTDAQGVFRQMLECAQSPDGWKNGDWASWESATIKDLSSKFPEHSHAEYAGIVRAVSYDWR